jgi:hypothetical protein
MALVQSFQEAAIVSKFLFRLRNAERKIIRESDSKAQLLPDPNQVGAGVELGSQEIVHLPCYDPPQTNGGHAQLSQHIHVDINRVIGNREAG